MRDVVGAEDVCVFCGVSAVPTDELGLAGPVTSVDMAAGGAALAGVGRVYRQHLTASPCLLIFELAAQLKPALI